MRECRCRGACFSKKCADGAPPDTSIQDNAGGHPTPPQLRDAGRQRVRLARKGEGKIVAQDLLCVGGRSSCEQGGVKLSGGDRTRICNRGLMEGSTCGWGGGLVGANEGVGCCGPQTRGPSLPAFLLDAQHGQRIFCDSYSS